ncbi:PIR Superfamily Protein [Plasmodium ovale curtisi]|uniref:PIR Superfamily Protein n=1 Tax=Plasmodium ovale curtisi TaxID=864141 RepID=A0A1A8X6N5_PLAOA|nr:PIR Superfamily Protein [Plasmodium ovale curtisi]SBT00917.1 PIR Superfamily Protein [Plasmodium ovale curtisi]
MSAEVTFTIYNKDPKKDIYECSSLYENIIDKVKEKIKEIDEAKNEDVHSKCEELDKYIENQTNDYKVCYEHDYFKYSLKIEDGIKKSFGGNNKYKKCLPQLMLREEDNKLTQKVGELREEKIYSHKERASEEQCQAKSEYNDNESCKKKCLDSEKLSDNVPELCNKEELVNKKSSSYSVQKIKLPSNFDMNNEVTPEHKTENSNTFSLQEIISTNLSNAQHSIDDETNSYSSSPSLKNDSERSYVSDYFSEGNPSGKSGHYDIISENYSKAYYQIIDNKSHDDVNSGDVNIEDKSVHGGHDEIIIRLLPSYYIRKKNTIFQESPKLQNQKDAADSQNNAFTHNTGIQPLQEKTPVNHDLQNLPTSNTDNSEETYISPGNTNNT